jgi:hypothetical protein
MSSFVFSGVAAALIGGAMLLSGTAPASAVPVSSPAFSAPAEAGLVEKVHRRSHHHSHRYDRHRHGPRYSYRRPGFYYPYGGYYYSSPWWIGPSVGFGITVPYVGSGSGSAHVQWCLDRYRSYDPSSDTFMGYDGYRHRCNSPFR